MSGYTVDEERPETTVDVFVAYGGDGPIVAHWSAKPAMVRSVNMRFIWIENHWKCQRLKYNAALLRKDGSPSATTGEMYDRKEQWSVDLTDAVRPTTTIIVKS